ncbi:DUF241 domain protein [Quillaja saponaria]|uniref:DUF241 domain protein n=1 Tax=Quillaja saponaria TaxID=32244 RepID=A0AAD7PFP8_QUISA|nr:DUF241 domain protein [Quillaja saponaria]
MKSLFTIGGAHQPVRSISLPSRIHPSSQRFEAVLNHLKALHLQSVSSTNHFGADAIQNGLVGLAELYNCMEELIQSPNTQQALLHYHNGKLVEEALYGSVTLLDACGSARDLLLTLKEHVQSLHSALRRRQGDSSIESSIAGFGSFRKKVKKDIAKQLTALKLMQSTVNSSYPLDLDQNLFCLMKVLREVTTVTISIFCSLLLFLSMPEMKTKGSSLISKLKPLRLFSSEKEHKIANEIGSVNIPLYSLIGSVKNSEAKAEVQGAQTMLETLNLSIDGLEASLDNLFRCLVQNRVSFLNMLTH